jgi:hypothetical protein
MRVRLAVPDMHVGPDVLNPMLEAVVRTNMHQIASGMVPPWDEALRKGVKWRPEPPGDEHFDPASTVVVRGHGDCDDLAPYSVATARMNGQDPYATAQVIEMAPGKFHAVHVTGDGDVLDPSADAGMHDYHAPIQPRLQGAHNTPRVVWKEVSGAIVSRCDIPTLAGDMAVCGHGWGESPAEAMSESIYGARVVGEELGISADHAMRMTAADALLRGADPAELAEVLHAMGHHNARSVVGSLFGSLAKIAKTALPIASKFVPIPGASFAGDLIANAIPGGGGGGGGAAAAAPAAAAAHPGAVPFGAPPHRNDDVVRPHVVVPPFVVRW